MSSAQGPSNGVRLLAHAVPVDPAAPLASVSSEPLHGPQQEQPLGGYTFEVRPGLFADIQPPRRCDHPYFQGRNAAIPGADCSQPWMRRSALELLSLFRFEEIVESSPGTRFVVAAILNDTRTEILRTELRLPRKCKNDGECLFLIERSNEGMLFVDVDAGGLPIAQFRWFTSLRGKETPHKAFLEERDNQYSDNEVPFRAFYETRAGSNPDAIKILYAWVSFDNGRVTHVNTADAFDGEELPGLRVEFGASVYGRDVHIWCMDRGLLSGMLTLHQHYFHGQIWIRNVLSEREESDLWEGVVPGEEMLPEEGVPGENADELGSDSMLLA